MVTGKGKKSYARSMAIYLALGLVLLAGIIGGLMIWYINQPQFFTLIIYLIVCLSLLAVYFVVLRAIFLNLNAGYEIDQDFLTLKDGFPNSKAVIVKLAEIDKVVLKKKKGWFFKGLANIVIVVSHKTYKLKNIDESVASDIMQKLEARNEI